MEIRPATSDDYEVIWSIIGPTIQAGETYALPCDMAKEEALAYWTGQDRKTFVAVEGGEVVGTYYLRPNQLGGGQHVANCGYMTAAHATGRGVARRMCEHPLEFAKSSGFRAMQFNLVISTNERALQLWERLGFSQVGRPPLAFNSPTQGLVDAIVMYRNL
jgi:RimJ/RimL family protein N-acetyltransferase